MDADAGAGGAAVEIVGASSVALVLALTFEPGSEAEWLVDAIGAAELEG